MQPAKQPSNQYEPTAIELVAGYLRRPVVLLPMLSVVTLVLYSGTVLFEFVWDDWPQIVNNPLIRSWHNLPQAFGSDLWYHVARQQVYYRPLFVVWSMLNYTVFALRPWGWHLGAIVVHVAAVLSVFWMARTLRLEYWTAALAALIFALHPVHIEPVAWISAASDSMVTMFAALAFGAFVKARNTEQRRRLLWRLVSLFFLACALLTKEMAITFAVLIGIYAWLIPNKRESSVWRRLCSAGVATIPYALVTIAYVLVRKHALLNASSKFDSGHSMVDVFRTLPMVCSIYLEKLVFPVGLTGLYYTPYVAAGFLQHVVAPASLLLAVAAMVWLWARRAKDPTIAFAGWWLVIGLAPALYLRNFGNGDFVRDRYMYLPSIGFALLSAIALRRLPAIRSYSASVVQVVVTLTLCLFYAGASIAQQAQWGNDLVLLVRGQEVYPENPYTLVRLSSEYGQRGAYAKAITLAESAARNHPEYVFSRFALSDAYIRAGRFTEGRAWLQNALSASPEYAASETGMAELAGLYGRMGDYRAALGYCDQILSKDPNLYSALYNCGNIQLMSGQYVDAEHLLERAVEAAPEQAAPRHFLGRALLEQSKNSEAQPYLESAVALDPKVWDYHFWLGESIARSGNLPRARAEYEEALRLNPDSVDARQRLATLEGR